MSLLKKAQHLLTGEKAELDASEYLKKNKLKLIQKNYRCKFGEIDLIMQDKQTLVFVEVRYRKNNQFGSGAETITPSKQKKLIKTASYYLQQHPPASQFSARFDVVSMTSDTRQQNSQNESKIDWIKDAFQA